MRTVLATRFVTIPAGVEVTVKARVVTVKGPRGELTKAFKSRSMDIVKVSDKRIRVDIWGGTRKELACLRTTTAHIENMITGLTKGFKYKMRFVYAHFPITGVINKGGHQLEIRNFLGEKRRRTINLIGDTIVVKSADVKDQIEISGINIEHVGRSCTLILHESTV